MKNIKKASLLTLFVAGCVLSTLSGCISVHRDEPASSTTTTSTTAVVPGTTVQRTTTY